ncbi:MAG: hypothetical protein GX606_01235 [Elusimicrobia bacterium]|nr:hypothetical protein [Elusimicrobiota bacterium]
MTPHLKRSGLICAAFLILLVSEARAVSDGFPSGKTLSGDHFSVVLASGIDEGSLVARLGIGPQHRILSGRSVTGLTFSGKDLPVLLDAFFVWACDILDMQLYSYKGTIKVAANGTQLKDVYRRLYGKESFSDKGFYVSETNTIYIAAGDFTKEILGHEIGHVIVGNYFVVQPPAKVHEVLAGYIEYQIRKLDRRDP